MGRAAVAGGRALRLAYADPPYPGNARLYRGHPDYAGEVDHAALIRRLGPYDGWALSTSAAALPAVLARVPARGAGGSLAPRGTAHRELAAPERVGAGHLPRGPPGGPRRVPARERRTDSLVHGVSPLTTLPGRVIGTKPAAFCRWVFSLLGAAPGDTLDDLFPGSGAVSRAWAAFTAAADPSHVARADASRLRRTRRVARIQTTRPPRSCRRVVPGVARDG